MATNLQQVVEAFKSGHNASGSDKKDYTLWAKTIRVIKKLPAFIKNA